MGIESRTSSSTPLLNNDERSNTPVNHLLGSDDPSTPSQSISFADNNYNYNNNMTPPTTIRGAADAAAAAHSRPSTPPINTTTNNNNMRHTDDIHPNRIISIQDSPLSNLSELSSRGDRSYHNRHHSSSSSSNKEPLNSKQQAAMDKFIGAKSKDDKARAWDELVRSLRESGDGGGGSSAHSRGGGSRGSKSFDNSSNHSLGFIQFHPRPSPTSGDNNGGGNNSVMSGLTNPNYYNTTPIRDVKFVVGGQQQQQQQQPQQSVEGGGDNNGNYYTLSPSNNGDRPPLFPPNSKGQQQQYGGTIIDSNLPMVSPLSVDGSYDDDDYDCTPEKDDNCYEEDVNEEGAGERISNALLNVDDENEHELAVYLDVDDEEEEISPLKGAMLFEESPESASGGGGGGTAGGGGNNATAAKSTAPQQPSSMPRLSPPKRDNNSSLVRGMIGRYEKEHQQQQQQQQQQRGVNRSGGSGGISPRRGYQLFSSRDDTATTSLHRQQQQFYSQWEQQPQQQQQQQQDWRGTSAPVSSTETMSQKQQQQQQQQRSPIYKSKKNNKSKSTTLEDQIRSVLQQNNDNDESDGNNKNSNRVPMKEKDTSAQDILLELSAEATPNNDHRHPPTSISFGEGKRNLRQQQQQQRMPKKVQSSEYGATNSKPVLLAPSRRDMTSLRIRKMVSEESAVLEGGATKHANNAASKTVAATTNHLSSPMIDDNTPSRKTSMLGGGLFPRTTPQRGGGAIIAPEQHRSSPTHSLDSASQISEIKASISELKNAGVGGVGKATSTLVWNESTGRYVIRDVDDESFHSMMEEKDLMGPPALTARESSYGYEEEDIEEQDTKFLFNIPAHITRGSILSDDVVDQAVMAATDGLSASSTSAADTSVDNDSAPPGDDDDDFFVVERSSDQSAASNKWRAFQQSSANDEFQLNSSWDGDDNGDDSFTSEPQWDADGWTDWDDSEAANDKRKMMPGKDPFNPFTQLVLQSLD